METINIHDAKTQFSKLIESVLQGKIVTIARAGKPVARLVPIEESAVRRKPGSMKDKISIAADFDAPLPAEIQAVFEGR